MKVIGSDKIVVNVVFGVLLLNQEDFFLLIKFFLIFCFRYHTGRFSDHETLSLNESAFSQLLIHGHTKTFASIDTVKEFLKLEIIGLTDADIILVLVQNNIKHLNGKIYLICDLFLGFGLEFPQVGQRVVYIEVTN